MSVPVREIQAVIEEVRQRRLRMDLVAALALGIAVMALGGWLGAGLVAARTTWIVSAAAGSVLAVVLYVSRGRGRTSAHAAREIERERPECRNTVVTAEELSRHPERSSAWMRDRVNAEASCAAAGVAVRDVVPASRTLFALGAALALLGTTIALPNVRDTAAATMALGRQTVDAVLGRSTWTLTVSLQPPPYSGLQSRTLIDPEQLEALEGTRLTFVGRGSPSTRVRFGSTPLGSLSDGKPVEHLARGSGYFAIEEAGGATRLIALSVIRDSTPAVKFEQPARDLLLSDTGRTVPLRITASDDLGLASLELRYTKVSGSGENFEFQEGTLPLTISRGSGRDWRAQAALALGPMQLSPGDSLVYRAVARDRRPGDAGLGASDTFYVEIAGPGQVPLEGIEMPPEEERYALSQQMIVLKIERLRARESRMTREALVEESSLLAAEQRSVRANFIFLLGGHVEDEEEEAEQSSEIAEGRLQNTARRDISQAIGHMTRAEQGLVAVNATSALPPARAAVESLQRAFGRSRYLLRALASRSRLDPSRRLTGNVATADDWRRALLEPEPRQGNALRALLASTLAAYEALSNPARPSPDLARLAERTLSIDPASARWQQLARRIQRAHEQRAQPAEARKLLDDVIGELGAAAGAALIPRAGAAAPASALERAWRDGGTR